MTLTSKNAVTPLDQKSPALISKRASELVTALLRCIRSLSRGKRRGSASTFLQTLVMNDVNRFRTPSCLCEPSFFTRIII